MSEAKSTSGAGRKVRSLDEEIVAQREKLRKLEERQKEQQRKERERNVKAVLELIRAEKLDAVSADQWKAAMPAIKTALRVSPAESVKPTQPVQKPANQPDSATIAA